MKPDKKHKTFTMKERSIRLTDTWDVIVAGGGPAGCAAATAAAEQGARTLLIEATGALGGMGTSGLVPAWCPFSNGEEIIYRGIAGKVFAASKAGSVHIQKDATDWVPIDPEHLKQVYDDMLAKAGVEVLFHTTLAAVEMAKVGRVDAVVVANKAGLAAHRARVYIDCTGDADLAAWAGAQYQQGDKHGQMQAATHCFILSNVDSYAFTHKTRMWAGYPDSPAFEVAKDPRFDLIRDWHFCLSLIGPGTVGFNAQHIWGVDGTDPASLSKAMPQGRKIAAQIRDAMAAYQPQAFGNAFLAATGSLMGIRESRRIVGDYVLTLDDFLARRSFKDDICRNSYMVDVHPESKPDARAMKKTCKLMLSGKICEYMPKGKSHGIPYRCLTPRSLANVLVAGRSISTDRPMQGSTRVMPVCLAMGEAAGVAAAQAATAARIDVHAVNTRRLRATLRKRGAYLP